MHEFYKIEKKIVKEFKEHSINLIQKDVKNDWDLLSIAQHYGLPTRLLDWTSDSLIALWFAFEEEKENTKDRIVWGLVVRNEYLVNFKKDNPYNLHERFIKVFEPIKIDPRIESQKSWFSIQNILVFKQGGGDGLPVFNEYNIINREREFEYFRMKMVMPNNLRKDILQKLDKLGINYQSIFSDLSGICKNIEWKHLTNKAIYINRFNV